MDKIRVLLVDDHAILREGLRAMLALQTDIEVVGEAADGAQAIDYVRRCRPDVVVMDIAMPGMSGLEATRRIFNEYPQTRVLVLSQHDDERYVLPVCQAGAAGYLLKRAVGEDLVRAIRVVRDGGSFLPPVIAETMLRAYRTLSFTGSDPMDELLTEREREVLALVAQGRTSKEIAELLHVSTKTVMCHRSNIYRKLGTHNWAELIKQAARYGLIELDEKTAKSSSTNAPAGA